MNRIKHLLTAAKEAVKVLANVEKETNNTVKLFTKLLSDIEEELSKVDSKDTEAFLQIAKDGQRYVSLGEIPGEICSECELKQYKLVLKDE